MQDRKMYPSLDIVKFIMALLILMQHTANEWAHSTGLVHAFFGLGNFAVPFFFACSGFLFFSKFNTLDNRGQKDYYRKWSIRIGKMYLVWSLIYFCFVFAGWVDRGLSWGQPAQYFHRALVFSTYATIWFLPALWIGVSSVYWMRRHCIKAVFWTTVIVLLIVGNLFGSYSNVMTHNDVVKSVYDWYMDVFITWRNGLFNAVPYIAIGLLLADDGLNKISIRVSLPLTVLFCGAFIIEAFCITRFHFSTATDMGFMMYPAIFFMMHSLILWRWVKPRPIWIHCRNLSMLIFLSQRLFLSAIPGVLPDRVSECIKAWPEPYIYLFFAVVVLCFSITVERLSAKYGFLKILW